MSASIRTIKRNIWKLSLAKPMWRHLRYEPPHNFQSFVHGRPTKTKKREPGSKHLGPLDYSKSTAGVKACIARKSFLDFMFSKIRSSTGINDW